MTGFSGRRLMRATAFLAGFVLAFPAFAQQTPPSPAQAEQQQQQDTMTRLLRDNPNGGGRLSRGIRDMVLADHSALSTIIGALADCQGPHPTSNGAQQISIGQGLGLAAKSVVSTDQAFATQIQQNVSAACSDAARTAYAAVTGDVATGAGASGGGGGGGASGGPTGAGPTGGGGANTGTFSGALGGTTTNGSALTGGTATSSGAINSQVSQF